MRVWHAKSGRAEVSLKKIRTGENVLPQAEGTCASLNRLRSALVVRRGVASCAPEYAIDIIKVSSRDRTQYWEVVQRSDTWLWTTLSGFESLPPSQHFSDCPRRSNFNDINRLEGLGPVRIPHSLASRRILSGECGHRAG